MADTSTSEKNWFEVVGQDESLRWMRGVSQTVAEVAAEFPGISIDDLLRRVAVRHGSSSQMKHALGWASAAGLVRVDYSASSVFPATPCPVCARPVGWGRMTPFGRYDEASALLNHVEVHHPEPDVEGSER